MHFVGKRIHLEAGIRIGWLRLPSEGAKAIEGAKNRFKGGGNESINRCSGRNAITNAAEYDNEIEITTEQLP